MLLLLPTFAFLQTSKNQEGDSRQAKDKGSHQESRDDENGAIDIIKTGMEFKGISPFSTYFKIFLKGCKEGFEGCKKYKEYQKYLKGTVWGADDLGEFGIRFENVSRVVGGDGKSGHNKIWVVRCLVFPLLCLLFIFIILNLNYLCFVSALL